MAFRERLPNGAGEIPRRFDIPRSTCHRTATRLCQFVMMNDSEFSGIISAKGITRFEPGSVPLPRASNELYARHRAAGVSPTEAARRVGLNPRNGAATKLERRRAVQERLAWLCRYEPDVAFERKRYAEERLALIHDQDIAEFYEVVHEPVYGKNGIVGHRMVQRPKFFRDLTIEQRRCIESYSVTDSGKTNLKLHDALAANREYRKLHGLDLPTKIAPTDPSGEHSAPVAPIINLMGHSERPEDEAA